MSLMVISYNRFSFSWTTRPKLRMQLTVTPPKAHSPSWLLSNQVDNTPMYIQRIDPTDLIFGYRGSGIRVVKIHVSS